MFFRSFLKNESGYSLVEVLAAIMILAIAIIPMVAMFDAGLRAANTSGNYDKARALANEKLEQAKSLSYSDVRDTFPSVAPTLTPASSASITSATDTDVFEGFSYQVRKRYLKMTPGVGANMDLTPVGATNAYGLIEVTVTVSWDNSSYSTTGVISKETL